MKNKKSSKAKMTIKEVSEEIAPDDSQVEDDEGQLENMEVDDEAGDTPGPRKTNVESKMSREDLQQLLEESGVRLVRNVVNRSKDICKFLSSNATDHCKELVEKVRKACEKHTKTVDKAEKFLAKVFPEDGIFSCESELFKTFLKYGMNNASNSESGWRIIEIIHGICSVAATAGKVGNPTVGIQMIVSHSSAADIFLESHQFVKSAVQNKKQINKQDGVGGASKKEEEEKYSKIKTQLLKVWRTLVISFTKISKTSGTPNDKKILENSVPYLFQMYSATMSEADQEIFQIIREYTGKRLQISIESMPLFGPKCMEPAANSKASNPLFAHSSKANTILGLINERKAFQTSMEFRENQEDKDNPNHYDFRFLLPLVCHALDSRNICDAVRVISNGWIYLIVKGLSFEDPVLRNLSFLAYKLLIQNFQLPKKGFKMQDIKVWLHFLLSVRKGMQSLGKCKISNLLATWMVASWETIRQPAHPMYQRLTTLLFAKPTIDLTVLPDFLPFYNATDGNRATREWMLNILSHGLQTREDWQVAQKLPTINSLCSSFLVEKVFVQRQILNILQGGATIPEMAQEMVDKHALMIWIANIFLDKKQPYGKELHDLFVTIKENCSENECRQLLFKYVSNVHCWTD